MTAGLHLKLNRKVKLKDSIQIIIPARYNSSRLPGKPLLDIGGQTMIQRTYLQAKKVASHVVVATDDQRIYDHVATFGEVVMTSKDHQSGTDRIYEAVGKLSFRPEYVINVQGDEPFIHTEQIEELASLLDGRTELATLSREILNHEHVSNPNIVKVVTANNGNALYFSRFGIPYLRDSAYSDKIKYFQHIGIYAYRVDILEEITKLPVSMLEQAESLEQLRWLENGYQIKVAVSSYENHGIDTADDLENARKIVSGR